MKPENYVLRIEEWNKKYEISDTAYIFDELSVEDLEELKKLDELGLVWTQHGTCENEQISFGMHELTGSGCGCWTTYAFHVGKHKGEEDFIDVEAYLPCSVCNPDGDGEGDPSCKGPEEVEGAETSDGCEEGFVQWYFT